MIEPRNNQNLVERYSPKKAQMARPYRPFWLPASNFYILATALTIAIFFISLAIFSGDDEKSLISAGLLASITLAGAVVVREILLRSSRYKILLAQERVGNNLKLSQKKQINIAKKTDKLTLDNNKEIIREIEQKSKKANEIAKLPELHWQVFELCYEYLQRSQRELEFIKNGSLRIPVLRQSIEKIQTLHKHHLLIWSSLESRSLIQDAKAYATISQKLENANKALMVLDSALEFYPNESELIESESAVKEFIATVKISHWIEQAERFAFRENYKRAVNCYRDALFYLSRENIRIEDHELIANKINAEIQRIKQLSRERT